MSYLCFMVQDVTYVCQDRCHQCTAYVREPKEELSSIKTESPVHVVLDSMIKPLLLSVSVPLLSFVVRFLLSKKGCMMYCSFNAVLAATSAIST